MADLNISFVPHNDMNPDEMDIVEQHKILIEKNKYSEATALLDNNNYQKGGQASLFNVIETRIQNIGIYLLNKFVAEPDELYSITEPSNEEMENKTYWIQPF